MAEHKLINTLAHRTFCTKWIVVFQNSWKLYTYIKRKFQIKVKNTKIESVLIRQTLLVIKYKSLRYSKFSTENLAFYPFTRPPENRLAIDKCLECFMVIMLIISVENMAFKWS